MRKETKEIIDEIIRQWGDDRLYVLTTINSDDNEVFTVVKDKHHVYEKTDSKPVPCPIKNKSGVKHNPDDVICVIISTRQTTDNEAFINFKGCYSIDVDFKGVFEYLKEFFGVIRAKARQMNAQGIKFKLGIIDEKKLVEVSNSFGENK